MRDLALPLWTLRRELIDILAAHYEAAEGSFPPFSPGELLADLNSLGPALGDECLPLIEMLLADMFDRGLIGRIPAPSPRHTPLYMTRESAEVAIKWGAPVMVRPMVVERETGDEVPPTVDS